MNEKLGLRKNIKKKKPDFYMQDFHKKKRLKMRWRKPKGIQSKMRLNIRGYRKRLSKGYSSPKEVRGLTAMGLKPVVVATPREIEMLDSKKECAVIKGTVGMRKKLIIITKAIENGVAVYSIKDPAAYKTKKEEEWRKRLEEKKKREKEKEEKKKKYEKKSKKEVEEKNIEEKIEASKTYDEKKEEEKIEMEKILTRKGGGH